MNDLAMRQKSLFWKNKVGLILIFFLFSTVVQFFINYDSPIHAGFKHIDGAWFLMCGKAMMNGMIPYVDFTDSKGPLLWLFNGLGYLIYPKGYEGIYVLFCIYFTAIFYLCYLTALTILNCGRRYALLASFAMSIPYFAWCHDEMRCEDICQLPLIYCIYRLSLAIRQPGSATDRKAAFIMGIGIGCCIMVKWNQAILQCLFPACIMIIAMAHRKSVCHIILFGFAGILTALAPWVITFSIMGNMQDFIQEYFCHTAGTFNGSQVDIMATASESLLRLISSRRIIAVLFIISPLIVFRGKGWMKWLPVVCGVCYMLLLTYGGADYYMTGMSGFAIFFAAAIISLMQRRWQYLHIAALSIATIIIIGLNVAFAFRYHLNIRFFHKNENFDKLNELIADVPDARIMHYNYYEQGLGLTSRTLPACRYWSMQSGGESFSRDDQLRTITDRKADFITVMSVNPGSPAPDTQKILDKYDYVYVGAMRDYFGLQCNLYARKELGLQAIDQAAVVK